MTERWMAALARAQKHETCVLAGPVIRSEHRARIESAIERGLSESLWLNRGLLFARPPGVAGWIAFPYFLLFEWAAPLLEGAGRLEEPRQPRRLRRDRLRPSPASRHRS